MDNTQGYISYSLTPLTSIWGETKSLTLIGSNNGASPYGDPKIFTVGLQHDFGENYQPIRFTFYLRTSNTQLAGPYVCLYQNSAGQITQAVTTFSGRGAVITGKYFVEGDTDFSNGITIAANVWYKVDTLIGKT